MIVLPFVPGAAVVLQLWARGGVAPQSSSAPDSAPDSARVVRSARAAQSSFEAFRRGRLPRGEDLGGMCDVRIGRYCYWRGDEGDDKQPEEPPPIREQRDALIRTLGSAAHALPGDGWIAGQYIRYLVEAERTDDALRAARDCRAEPFWCAALAGYAAHLGGRYAVADSAYNASLAGMSDAERCRWLDISDIAEDELIDKYDPLDCTARERFARSVLWLGSPLLSVSTSDLLTEHLARLTRARIAEHSAATDGEPWASDERQVMVRYGWPHWYTRKEPDFGSLRARMITGHDAAMPYYFLPTVRVLEHVGQTARDDWHLDDRRARTGYGPAYARTVHDAPSQIAAFRRGESTLVVAAWDARDDTTLVGRDLDVALVIAGAGELRAVERVKNARATGRISAIGVIDSGLVSLELLAPQDRRAARARIGLPPRTPGRIAVSDLLLYAPSGTPVDSLDAARETALASDKVPPSRAVGVYWETYGLAPEGEHVHFTLTVEQVGVGWMRRAAERLHVTDPTSGLRVQWEEVPRQTNGIAGRGVRVDLSRLRGGRYRVELTVAAPNGTATSVREIEAR